MFGLRHVGLDMILSLQSAHVVDDLAVEVRVVVHLRLRGGAEGSEEDERELEKWLLSYLETWNENLSTAGVTDIALALNKPLENSLRPCLPHLKGVAEYLHSRGGTELALTDLELLLSSGTWRGTEEDLSGLLRAGW